MQVASALVKLDAPESLSMAVIPMGTANDFATSIGLPEDPWEALQLCTMDTAQPIDVGLVNDKVKIIIQPQWPDLHKPLACARLCFLICRCLFVRMLLIQTVLLSDRFKLSWVTYLPYNLALFENLVQCQKFV